MACVISFDVLEHILVNDVPVVLRDMFSQTEKLLVLNVAGYPAAAQLPNGENAHATVREPMWWKGLVDGISIEFPRVSLWLLCSTAYRKTVAYDVWQAGQWERDNGFVVTL